MGHVVRINDYERPHVKHNTSSVRDRVAQVIILPVGYVKIERDDMPDMVTAEMFKNAERNSAFKYSEKPKKK